jgi:hypothetical protein
MELVPGLRGSMVPDSASKNKDQSSIPTRVTGFNEVRHRYVHWLLFKIDFKCLVCFFYCCKIKLWPKNTLNYINYRGSREGYVALLNLKWQQSLHTSKSRRWHILKKKFFFCEKKNPSVASTPCWETHCYLFLVAARKHFYALEGTDAIKLYRWYKMFLFDQSTVRGIESLLGIGW